MDGQQQQQQHRYSDDISNGDDEKIQWAKANGRTHTHTSKHKAHLFRAKSFTCIEYLSFSLFVCAHTHTPTLRSLAHSVHSQSCKNMATAQDLRLHHWSHFEIFLYDIDLSRNSTFIVTLSVGMCACVGVGVNLLLLPMTMCFNKISTQCDKQREHDLNIWGPNSLSLCD